MHMTYPQAHWLPTIAVFFVLMLPFSNYYKLDSPTEEENLEEVIRKSGGYGLPTGSLNFRRSAHFLEINSIYGAEMTRRVC
jgi:hypothetical protein